jgi:hypothetical protein
LSEHKGHARIVAVLLIVFLTIQLSQALVTPFGEGMDELWHFAYVVFFSDKGYPPLPGDHSFPEHLLTVNRLLPSPAYPDDQAYRLWAEKPLDERRELCRVLLQPEQDPQYMIANYQSQHPPLYHWLLSLVYARLSNWRLDRLALVMRCVSIILAAVAIPALYLTFKLYVPSNAVLATLIAAWYPCLMPFLGRITNDALAFSLMAWSVYLVSRPQKGPLSVSVASILVVLGFFTKSYFLAIAPVIFLLCVIKTPEQSTRSWKKGALGTVLIMALGIGLLLALNFVNTGHLLLLNEIRDTAEYSVGEKVAALFHISLIWFLGGLVLGFLWTGYWSFVSPGWFYYAPLLLIVLLFVWKVARDVKARTWLDLRALWSHYLLIGMFLLGMWWHAAMFSLLAQAQGQVEHAGNEGWYLNVLIGSVLLCFFVWMKTSLSCVTVKRFLKGTLSLMLLWNLVARGAMIVFWSGAASIGGRFRTLSLSTNSEHWRRLIENWVSLPGVYFPLILVSLALLLLAVFVTIWVGIYKGGWDENPC